MLEESKVQNRYLKKLAELAEERKMSCAENLNMHNLHDTRGDRATVATENVQSEDLTNKLDAEHMQRLKEFETVNATKKQSYTFKMPKWFFEKGLTAIEIEQLEYLLRHCPETIEGCKLTDVLEYADPKNDYLQLRDPELLKLFSRTLQEYYIKKEKIV